MIIVTKRLYFGRFMTRFDVTRGDGLNRKYLSVRDGGVTRSYTLVPVLGRWYSQFQYWRSSQSDLNKSWWIIDVSAPFKGEFHGYSRRVMLVNSWTLTSQPSLLYSPLYMYDRLVGRKGLRAILISDFCKARNGGLTCQVMFLRQRFGA